MSPILRIMGLERMVDLHKDRQQQMGESIGIAIYRELILSLNFSNTMLLSPMLVRNVLITPSSLDLRGYFPIQKQRIRPRI